MSYQALERHGGKNSYDYMNESSLKGYRLNDSNYMTLWKRHKYGDSDKIGCCQGLQERKEQRGGTEDFQDSEAVLYCILFYSICYIVWYYNGA